MVNAPMGGPTPPQQGPGQGYGSGKGQGMPQRPMGPAQYPPQRGPAIPPQRGPAIPPQRGPAIPPQAGGRGLPGFFKRFQDGRQGGFPQGGIMDVFRQFRVAGGMQPLGMMPQTGAVPQPMPMTGMLTAGPQSVGAPQMQPAMMTQTAAMSATDPTMTGQMFAPPAQTPMDGANAMDQARFDQYITEMNQRQAPPQMMAMGGQVSSTQAPSADKLQMASIMRTGTPEQRMAALRQMRGPETQGGAKAAPFQSKAQMRDALANGGAQQRYGMMGFPGLMRDLIDMKNAQSQSRR